MTNSNYFELWKRQHAAKYRAVYGAGAGKSNPQPVPPPVPPRPTAKYTPIDVPGLDGRFVFKMTNAKDDLNEQNEKKYLDWVSRHSGESSYKFGCSGAVYKDYSGSFSYHARNMDWYYDNNVSMINVTPKALVEQGVVKHASIGMCLCRCTERDLFAMHPVGEDIPDEVKLIPYFIDDGINDAGLSIQMNVIPYKEGVWRREQCKSEKPMPDRIACRYVLDNFSEAKEAANWICENCYYSGNEFNYHWIVSDKNYVFLVEDGRFYEINKKPYMTNFRCAEAETWYDNEDDRVNHLMETDRYGMGLERYDFIQRTYPKDYADIEYGFKVFTSIWYSNSYVPRGYGMPTGSPWWTETCANYEKLLPGLDYTIYNAFNGNVTIEYEGKQIPMRELIYDKVAQDAAKQGDERRPHDKWQTTWTLVFDRAGNTPKMHAMFQQKDTVFTFNLDGTMIRPVK